MPSQILSRFHPAVAQWFTETLGPPTEAQARGWEAIMAGRHTLVAAPTGSGKTLAAFLTAVDALVRQGLNGGLTDATQVLYVSPLKALSNDIQRNLAEPLREISEILVQSGEKAPGVRTLVRTGDTPASERAAMAKRPPHILVTTPESLYILLTSDSGRRMLATVRTVIVDEIHALVRDKRGAHLALSLERLEALTGGGLVRVGLSATQRPIAEVARFLVGRRHPGGQETPDCAVIDVGHSREVDLAIEVPDSPLEAVMAAEVWGEVFDRIATLIQGHRTTLIFVNTRRMAERVARDLSERVGAEQVSSHHGSMAKEHRLEAEQRLKAGSLRALVATASLELGIDIGAVELVCQIGSPRSIAAFLQRVGRSGHQIGGLPKGRLFPVSRDDLVECAALLDARRRGELDLLVVPAQPLDILAQQIVAAVSGEEWLEDDLYAVVRRAYPYRDLSREEFERVVRMLADGFTTRRGRRGAHIYRDAVNGRLRGRRGARLTAITSGGAIPDNADYDVVLEPSNTRIGTLNEDFAIESMAGDIFQLGNASWRILRVEAGKVRVEDARGLPPTLPFWLGEAPGRTAELSAAVSRLREEINERLILPQGELPLPLPLPPPPPTAPPPADGAIGAEAPPTVPFFVGADPRPTPADYGGMVAGAVEWLVAEVGLSDSGATQLAEYLAASRMALGAMPSQDTLVVERFFDEAGGMQLVLHAPFGSRLNRAWGLALRKRFCRKFNFELQAAATDDAIVLSLGATHSFPLDDVFRYLHSASVRTVLVQALLDAPMFATRWRWNATRSLAVPRWRGGRKVPAPLLRMAAEDLVAVVFPDQLACLENVQGDREIPDHPLINQTLHDCLTEAMDIEALEGLLQTMERGGKTLLAKDMREPSPLAHEILNAKPYAFLDDAPLEERRTQAVITRRWVDPQTAAGLGALDAAAIARVREEAWPEAGNHDELHDALVLLGYLTEPEGQAMAGGEAFFRTLRHERRATTLITSPGGPRLWVAAERIAEIQAVFSEAEPEPPLAPAPGYEQAPEPQQALAELVRGRLEGLGPLTVATLAGETGLPLPALEAALISLEGEGFVLRGSFTPGGDGGEWCERRLLARIHRYTLERLRKEIEPVSSAEFMRFLLDWHKASRPARVAGQEGLAAVLAQLEGFEAAAGAWEEEILPLRMERYDPTWLDALCLSGRQTWLRRSPPSLSLRGSRGWSPVRATPIALVSRKKLALWRGLRAAAEPVPLSAPARTLWESLQRRGASFFADLPEMTGLLPTQVETALAELAALGLVASDSFAGLRALLKPAHRRGAAAGPRRRRGASIGGGMDSAGRWAPLPEAKPDPERATAAPPPAKGPGQVPAAGAGVAAGVAADVAAEVAAEVAWVLLRRYGVVFKSLLERESPLPPWREMLRAFRNLEARGEIRGGRFVEGFSGEQFALPEAVGSLRAVRRKGETGEMVTLSAADPLNLVGILLPGPRLPAKPANRLLVQDGKPVAVREGGKTHFLAALNAQQQWEVHNALLRLNPPVSLQGFRQRKEQPSRG